MVVVLLLGIPAAAQNVSSKTNTFEVDYSDPNKLMASAVPAIQWVLPLQEQVYASEKRYKFNLVVESSTPLKSVTIMVRDSPEAPARATLVMPPDTDAEKFKKTIEKNVVLLDGNNLVEVVAENLEGVKSFSSRTITVGSASLADAAKLDRTDYAVLFVTNDYDNWPDLVNPVFDGRMIADELTKNFKFKVELMEGKSQNEILKKLREYAEKKYKPLDQLFIFFAGHGQFDQTFGEGYVVTKESLANDEAKTTYLSHNRLRSIVDNIPCEHIFLAMDVCFGGTFDDALAHRGMDDDVYKEVSQAELVTRKLTYKTRRYMTSGGKEYVPDGRPGMNSPFARKLLEALRSRGGKDLILTLGELDSYIESLKPQPRAGEFGSNAPGSDFIFIVK